MSTCQDDQDETLKRCYRCKTWKGREDFSRRRAAKDGLNSKCKPCNREVAREWRERNRDEVLEYYRRYDNGPGKQRRAERYAEGAARYADEGAYPLSPESLTEVSYSGAHQRILRAYGPAKSHPCAGYGCTEQATSWALIVTIGPHVRTEWRKDTRSPDSPAREVRFSINPQAYRPLCHSCHIYADAHGLEVVAGPDPDEGDE